MGQKQLLIVCSPACDKARDEHLQQIVKFKRDTMLRKHKRISTMRCQLVKQRLLVHRERLASALGASTYAYYPTQSQMERTYK